MIQVLASSFFFFLFFIWFESLNVIAYYFNNSYAKPSTWVFCGLCLTPFFFLLALE